MAAAAPAAAANPYRIPDVVDAELRAAFTDLYNLRFDAAQKRIDALQPEAEAHPMVGLAQVVLEWWKITVSVSENDEKASVPFLAACQRSLRLAESVPRKADRRAEARVVAGTTVGLMSRWSAANRAWLPAYARGTKASAILLDALKTNPAATDAYMTLGTFNYARELLRRKIGTPAGMDPPEAPRALNELRRAYNEGTYFREAAGVLLASVLINDDPKESVRILRELRIRLPECAFVHQVLITALYNAGDIASMTAETADMAARIEAGSYGPWFRPQVFFAQGMIQFRARQWKDASRLFGEAMRASDDTNPFGTWARLYQGYAFDAMGSREAARTRYREVLKRRARFASREHAEERMRRPFQVSDVEMERIEL